MDQETCVARASGGKGTELFRSAFLHNASLTLRDPCIIQVVPILRFKIMFGPLPTN